MPLQRLLLLRTDDMCRRGTDHLLEELIVGASELIDVGISMHADIRPRAHPSTGTGTGTTPGLPAIGEQAE